MISQPVEDFEIILFTLLFTFNVDLISCLLCDIIIQVLCQHANVAPIFKKGSKLQAVNYRSVLHVSYLSTLFVSRFGIPSGSQNFN